MDEAKVSISPRGRGGATIADVRGTHENNVCLAKLNALVGVRKSSAGRLSRKVHGDWEQFWLLCVVPSSRGADDREQERALGKSSLRGKVSARKR